MPPDVHVTTPQIWLCTSLLLLVDAVLILVANRIINQQMFEKMSRLLVISGGVFFLLVWTAAMIWAWDWFYSYIFPAWAHSLLPLLFGVFYTLLAWGMFWLSLKLPGNPAVTWCILGGLEGLLSHIYAIFGLGAVSKPPIMQGADPIAVTIFAIFEVGFYWILILLFDGMMLKVFKRGSE